MKVSVKILYSFRRVGTKGEWTIITLIPTIGIIAKTKELRIVLNWMLWQISFIFTYLNRGGEE